MSAAALPDLPAIRRLAGYGARFVLWRWEERNGRPDKPPRRTNGRLADSTKPATWSTLARCEEAAREVGADGTGFVLAAERDAAAGKPAVAGIDLDGCRDPATGELKPWATEIVRDLDGYAEVSPSGTGVKLFCLVDPAPELAANRLVIQPANGAGKAEQIEIFTTGRYFTVTGEHVAGTPDDLTDATEAFARLAARIVREGGSKAGKAAKAKRSAKAGGTAKAEGDGRVRPDGTGPSGDTMRLVLGTLALAKLWRGEKAGGDTTASGMDWSLARALGRAGVADDEIARVLTRYAHGQVGGGKLGGRAAERRLGRLVRAAGEAREATPREEPAPYFTADEKPVERAVAELRALLDAFIVAAAHGSNPGAVEAIAAAAGIGKTVEVLRALLRHRRPGFVTWLSLPTHALCIEVAGKASGLGLRVRLALGRKAEPDGTSLCRKPEIVEAVAHASLPVMTSVCRQEVGDGEIRRCAHYATCPYLAQFRLGEVDLVLVPHASLPFLSKLPKVPGELGLPPPSLLVIDERPVDTLLKADQSFTFDQLTAPRDLRVDEEAELRGVVVAVRDALEQDRDPRDAADAETFRRVAGFEATPPRQAEIWPSLPADEQRRRALALRSHPRRLIAEFLRILADTKDADRFPRRIKVRLALKGPDGVPRDRVLVHGRDPIDHRGAPVLLLDAAFDARQARAFFPDAKEHVIAVRRNCHVIQVCDNSCSKRRFLGRKDPSEEDLRSAAARREELGWLIEREVERAEGRGVLVVMPAALEHAMPAVPGADFAHYNALRGLDAYRDHHTVIAVSREQLPDRAAEALARALFGDDDAPLDLPGEYGEENRGYRLRDGSRKGAKVMVHPDHRVQSLVESTREREIEQAVDRLRTVHRVEPARVLILTNVPIDITVDELVRWRDLIPSRIEVAMTRLRAGVLPLNPTWLAERFPELWPSPRAAECDVARAAKTTQTPYRVLTIGFAYFSVASYRVPLQRGRPSLALVRQGHLSPLLALSREVGPLASFELPGWTEEPEFEPYPDDEPGPIGPSPWLGRSAFRAAMRAAAGAARPEVDA